MKTRKHPVISIERNKDHLTFNLDSDMSCVHPLIRRFEELTPDWGLEHSGNAELVLRELLSNAIAHGNHHDLSRKVCGGIERTSEGAIKITVQDEGAGFDFTSIDTRMPDDPRNIHQRGYILIRKICREMEFNLRGNRVTVCIDAPETCVEVR